MNRYQYQMTVRLFNNSFSLTAPLSIRFVLSEVATGDRPPSRVTSAQVQALSNDLAHGQITRSLSVNFRSLNRKVCSSRQRNRRYGSTEPY